MSNGLLTLVPYLDLVQKIEPMASTGEITEMVGLLIESRGPSVAAGSFCEVRSASGKVIRTQVVGFRNGRVLSIPLEETDGVQLGDNVIARSEDSRVVALCARAERVSKAAQLDDRARAEDAEGEAQPQFLRGGIECRQPLQRV